MFLQSGQTKKLWQKIGLDRHQSEHLSHSQIQFVESDKSSQKISPMQSLKQSLIEQKLNLDNIPPVVTANSNKMQSLDQKAQKFQNLMEKLNLQVRQIEESEQIIVANEESHIQQHTKFDKESSQKCEELDSFYNYDLSRAPESVVPLVYSKNSRKAEEVRFRKENARLVMLKLSISEFKRSLKGLKQELQTIFNELRNSQQNLRQQICSKYYDLQRQYSMKVQESMFIQKQEYQQLKYQYQMLKAKEQTAKSNTHSEFMIPEMEMSAVCGKCLIHERRTNDLASQNQRLKDKINILMGQKQKLTKQSSAFKRKIAEIEGFTGEIRQSNDKLYEYIFDLQQQLAFHKEEVPKIKKMITEEMEDYYSRQLQKKEAEKQSAFSKIQFLESQLKTLSEDSQKQKAKVAIYEKELEKLRSAADKYKIEEGELLKLNEERVSELLAQLKQKEEEIANSRKLIEEKDIMLAEYLETINRSKLSQKGNGWQYQEQKVKTREKLKEPRESRAQNYQLRDRDERKLLQALQIDKMVLQKQNMQLKATLQFYNKMGNSQLSYPPPVNRQAQTFTNYYIAKQPVSTEPSIPESNLYLKQRELLKYQGFLQSQAQRLEAKQKEMQIQMTVRKNIEQKYKESYNVPERMYELTAKQDDYGMKHVVTHPHRHSIHNTTRKNNFCSSEAQAIIEKVKMRQGRRPQDANYHCRCQDIRNCRCEVLSRGSRASRDSNSRDYVKMQHYRPSNYSPANHVDDYLRRDDKSSKMKLIEDKVKRLKSELKNSLSSMKD